MNSKFPTFIILASFFGLSTGAALATPVTEGSATLNASSAAGATVSPFLLGNFGTATTTGYLGSPAIPLAHGGLIVETPNASTPNAGLYAGNTGGVAVSPFGGTSLPQAGTDARYLVAEPNDPVEIFLGTPSVNIFSLLWGSVDTYNSLALTFYNGSTVVGSGTFSGSDVATSIGGGFVADGTTPAFVTITDSVAFNLVVITSTSAAFEFVPSVQVPEPASLTLFGAFLLFLGAIRLRKNARAS